MLRRPVKYFFGAEVERTIRDTLGTKRKLAIQQVSAEQQMMLPASSTRTFQHSESSASRQGLGIVWLRGVSAR
jgi:hypothetical protein